MTERDAQNTRLLLVSAARRRFAHDGYSATTVRDIAADAGVNVALISRYFGSKDGLFQACLRETMSGLAERTDVRPSSLETLVERMVEEVVNSPSSDVSLQLLLLLRTSGDDRADEMRRQTLETFTQRILSVASNDDTPDSSATLRAQLAVATLLGLAIMRTSTGLEPVTSATPEQLGPALNDLLTHLLTASESE